jgi:hypothetical protein
MWYEEVQKKNHNKKKKKNKKEKKIKKKKPTNCHQTEPTTVVHLSQVPVCPKRPNFYHGA